MLHATIFWWSPSQQCNFGHTHTLVICYFFVVSHLWMTITLISDEHHAFQITGNLIACSTDYSCNQQKTSRFHITWSFLRGIHWWFPSQMASNAESISMSWPCHDDYFGTKPVVGGRVCLLPIVINKCHCNWSCYTATVAPKWCGKQC